MTVWSSSPQAPVLVIVAAGAGGGFCANATGLAALPNDRALLTAGLPPLVADVTNTVAVVGTRQVRRRFRAGAERPGSARDGEGAEPP